MVAKSRMQIIQEGFASPALHLTSRPQLCALHLAAIELNEDFSRLSQGWTRDTWLVLGTIRNTWTRLVRLPSAHIPVIQLLVPLIHRPIREVGQDFKRPSGATPHHTHAKQNIYTCVCVSTYSTLYICDTLNIPLGVSLEKLELQSQSYRYSIS